MKKKICSLFIIIGLVSCLFAGMSFADDSTKDVYIDNTVDNSVSYVTGAVCIMGSGGEQAGYSDGKVIYSESESASVTYSNPRTTEVQGYIDEAYAQVQAIAEDIKARGKSGEINYSTSTSTGKVWDNRQYDTIEDGDAVLIGAGTDTSGITTRTHIASGDYGKETFYRVEANGYVTGWDITCEATGNGSVTTDYDTALSDTTVTVTIAADNGWVISSVYVGSSEGQIIGAIYGDSGETEDSMSFTMPKADVEVSVDFVEHKHTLVHMDAKAADCENDGNIEYWTCSGCGKNFSDEAGTSEISGSVTIAALGHDWGEWTVTKDATPEAEGEKTRVCSRDSSHKETEAIPRIEISYENTAGNGGEHTQEGGGTLSFTFERSYEPGETFSHFTGVKVDGEDLSAGNFSAVSGSVIVTLNADYLDTLEAGTHTLTAVFDDGEATSTFTINAKAEEATEETTIAEETTAAQETTAEASSETQAAKAQNSKVPKTADSNSPIVWVIIMAAALLSITIIARVRRER